MTEDVRPAPDDDAPAADATDDASAASATDALLSVEHLATGYGDLRVVWDVSFSVQPGTITAVLGRNGAGKTTTLRAIAGLNRTTSGSVRFRGEDISGLPAHRRTRKGIAFVQEGKQIFHRRTVQDNLVLGGYGRAMRRREAVREVDRIYELFPALRARAKTTAGQLSGGQQQMVAIGQALMSRPALLMLDEPSGGLAPSVVAEVMASVGALTADGLGIVLVEQAVESALAVADQVVVLDIGRVVVHCAASAVGDLDILREAYLGRTSR